MWSEFLKFFRNYVSEIITVIAMIVIIIWVITETSKKDTFSSRPNDEQIDKIASDLEKNKDALQLGFDHAKSLIPGLDIVTYEKARILSLQGGSKEDFKNKCFN